MLFIVNMAPGFSCFKITKGYSSFSFFLPRPVSPKNKKSRRWFLSLIDDRSSTSEGHETTTTPSVCRCRGVHRQKMNSSKCSFLALHWSNYTLCGESRSVRKQFIKIFLTHWKTFLTVSKDQGMIELILLFTFWFISSFKLNILKNIWEKLGSNLWPLVSVTVNSSIWASVAWTHISQKKNRI